MFPFSNIRGGGAVAGSTTTLSPTNKDADWSLTNGNLTATHTGSTFSEVRATAAKASSGAFTATRQTSGASTFAGLTLATSSRGDYSMSASISYENGQIFLNNNNIGSPTGAIPTGTPLLVELGSDGTTVTFSVGGTARGSVQATAGQYLPVLFASNSQTFDANFNPSGKPSW